MSDPGEVTAPQVAASPTSPPAQYEFGPTQNALIENLASKMLFVGLFGLAIGVLVLLPGIARFEPASIIAGVVYLLIALWTRVSGHAFRQVVRTRGADVTHLMIALEALRKLYTLTFWLCILAIISLVVLLTAQLLDRPAAIPVPPSAPSGLPA